MGISLLLVYVKVGVPRGMVGLIIAHVTFCVSFVILTSAPVWMVTTHRSRKRPWTWAPTAWSRSLR